MWAHGLRLDPRFLIVDNPPYREWLVSNGFAWAASSYSTTGLDITTGVKDTHALAQFVNGVVSKPDRVYISGHSMGGAITVTSIEQWPNTYDGAMPVCGALAIYENIDYLLDYYVVSNALAGFDASLPIPDGYATGTYQDIKAALELFPGTFPYLLNTQGEKLKDATELLTGGERPTFDQAFVFWYGMDFLIEFGFNDQIVDNKDTIYQFDSDPFISLEEQALNDAVLRVEREPYVLRPNGLKNLPYVNGDITTPVLSLHTLGDLFVPFSMEQIYAQRVAEQGASDLLVQRAIRNLPHCGFTYQELVTGFSDLVNWVENGVKPAGDEILNPATVAHPDFGCQFTSEDRIYPPILAIQPCP
jgi:hypothetical protein